MSTEASTTVNPHYLDHVAATAQTRQVEVTEDIVATNGIKLLAKGARVDFAIRERLLEHKLRKRLEDCVQVVDGVAADRIEAVGEGLLARHAVLRALCASERARSAAAALAAAPLSSPMRSLLTIYAQCQEGRLEHTVGVAMLAAALGRRLLPDAVERHRRLGIAGLVHDVGELYIDPAILRAKSLDGPKWRHIVTHPWIGHRVLRDMEGAGRAVADAVLLHHERLDGFGYPRGIEGGEFALDGQILAAAEWLMALVEADQSPLTRARMAERLIPGEVSPELLAVVAAAAREAPDAPVELAAAPPLEEALPRIARLAGTLQRFGDARALIDERIAAAEPGLRAVLAAGLNRMLRIQASFSSTGFDAYDPRLLLAELAALCDPGVYVEIMTLVGELEWRMRELERAQRLRASLLAAPEHAVVEDLIAQLSGASAESTSAQR